MFVPDATEDGLIAFYTFDDAMGLDSSGQGHHASVVPQAGPGHGPTGNGCACRPCRHEARHSCMQRMRPKSSRGLGADRARPLPFRSARFDGVRLMEVAHSEALNSNDLSVSLWVYLLEDSTNSYRTIFRKAAEAADMTPTLMLLPNDRRLHVRLSTDLNVANGFDSTAVIPLRRWTHIAYVLKGGATLTLYVNGVKDCPVLGSNVRQPMRPCRPVEGFAAPCTSLPLLLNSSLLRVCVWGGASSRRGTACGALLGAPPTLGTRATSCTTRAPSTWEATPSCLARPCMLTSSR